MSSSFLAPSDENKGWVGLMLDDFFAGKHIAKLLGGLEHVLFLHILGIIIPTAFHIFRGVETTNQKINRKRSFIIWPHLSTNLTFKPHKWERREYQWIINRILTGILMEKAGTMDGKRMICIYYIIYIYIICVHIYLFAWFHKSWWLMAFSAFMHLHAVCYHPGLQAGSA